MTWTPPAAAGRHGLLAVRVCDTGVGIAPDKLDGLFQMFTQADTSTARRYGGTGLGLAICQRLVLLMGGKITVRSKPAEGSEFFFSLPLSPVALAADEPPSPPPTTSAAPASAMRPSILVVDDMETNRLLLEIFLRNNGFEPHLAFGGAEAVRLAAGNRYDAILMDLQMPEVDGYTATRLIRAAEPAGKRALIIALTASLARGTREKCLAAGMDEHLTKPLDLRRFKSVLHAFIRASSTITPPINANCGAK
jgi:CheY-like chemotaxis protein